MNTTLHAVGMVLLLTACINENDKINGSASDEMLAGKDFHVRHATPVTIEDSRSDQPVVIQGNLQDARCPADAECVSAGFYSGQFTIVQGTASATAALCNGICSGGYAEESSAEFMLDGRGYRLTLKDMKPFPTTTNQEEPKVAIVELKRL